MFRVGLLWHSLSSGNLGVRALTLAQLHLLDAAAAAAGRRVEVTLFGHPRWGGLEDSRFEGAHVAVGDTWDLAAADLLRRPAALRRALRRCDLLIDVSEGDSFTDLYGTRRYLKQTATKLLALRSGRPLLLAPQTLGPFAGRLRERVAAHVMRRAARVFARDGLSAAYARRLTGRDDVAELADLAFALPYTAPARPDGGPVRVGLNISGLLYADGDGSRFGLAFSYPRLTEALIEAFLARPGVELILVPHVLSPPPHLPGRPDQDVAVAAMLASRFPGLVAQPPFADPRAAKSFIAGLDFFVGARMHACIAAFSSGVPLLPLAYSRKSTGLFRSLGYDLVGDMAGGSPEQIRALALAAFDRREALRRRIAAGNRLAQERLAAYRDALAALLAGRA